MKFSLLKRHEAFLLRPRVNDISVKLAVILFFELINKTISRNRLRRGIPHFLHASSVEESRSVVVFNRIYCFRMGEIMLNVIVMSFLSFLPADRNYFVTNYTLDWRIALFFAQMFALVFTGPSQF